MRKMIMLIGLSITLLQGCASYKPVIDTNGRSGTFNEDKARMITDDLQHCKTLAKDNTNTLVESGKAVYNVWWRASTLWLSDKLEYKYPKIYRNCMNNRGHSVVN
tara:strand:- start:52 stop:366 length:315 start_codon:yes stop_codon:yes gene_type:complete